MDNIKANKAYIARSWPAEKLLDSALAVVLTIRTNVDTFGRESEFAKRLLIANRLCETTLKTLLAEMDVRGPTETLAAIDSVQKTKLEVENWVKKFAFGG